MKLPLRESVIYEAVATFAARGSCHPTPLGVWVEEGKLYARLYPSNPLYTKRLDDCAVIVYPVSPLEVVKAYLGVQKPMDFGLCCPVYAKPYIIVEAKVLKVHVDKDNTKLVEMVPLKQFFVEQPEPFTRITSCLVELAVVASRLRLWKTCREKLERVQGVMQCMDLLARRTRGEARDLFTRLLTRLFQRLGECRDVEELIKGIIRLQ